MMRAVLAELSISPGTADFDGGSGGGAASSSSWLASCHGIWYNLALIIPTVIFIAYLASQARKSYAKLTYGRSHIMITYYALMWIISVLNLLWCLLQTWQCTTGKEFSWNTLSLLTKSGLLFLEISVIAFMMQGNYASGVETLSKTFAVSGVIVTSDFLLKVVYVFGFGVQLFIDSYQSGTKWGLWIVHILLLTSVYGFILFMHHSKWKERLPARPAFYHYICAMLLLNSLSLFGCILIGSGSGFGSWLYNLTMVCYHSLYLPLLYVTFLADFFQEEDMRLENVYYSEMKDAGFFDADWE